MEPAKILFQASDDQCLVSTASKSPLNLFAHPEILGIEHVCVDQFKRAPPVLFGLLLCRPLNIVCTNSVWSAASGYMPRWLM